MSRHEATDFANELRAHMDDWCAAMGRRPPMWARWTHGIHPTYLDLAREVQVPGADVDGLCPFGGNAQQPMRNLAIARALEQEGMVDEAWFVLCAHDGNPDVPGHWKAWAELLPDPAMAPSLPASAVIDAGEAEGYGAWAAWIRDRYRLGEPR